MKNRNNSRKSHNKYVDRYVFYNPNPVSKDVGDCVIRALSVVTGKDWLTLFDELTEVCRRVFSLIDNQDVFSLYLREHAYACCEYEGRMPTLYEFAKAHPKGKYFVIVPEHAVGVKDGKYYDTFDAGKEPVIAFYLPRSAMKHHKHKGHKLSRKHKRHK